MAASYSEAIQEPDASVQLVGHQDQEAVTAVQQIREAAAVGRFLRYLAALEQDRSLTGGGATDWCAYILHF